MCNILNFLKCPVCFMKRLKIGVFKASLDTKATKNDALPISKISQLDYIDAVLARRVEIERPHRGALLAATRLSSAVIGSSIYAS